MLYFIDEVLESVSYDDYDKLMLEEFEKIYC